MCLNKNRIYSPQYFDKTCTLHVCLIGDEIGGNYFIERQGYMFQVIGMILKRNMSHTLLHMKRTSGGLNHIQPLIGWSLEMPSPFTVPFGYETLFLNHSHQDSNPGLLHSSPLYQLY